MFVLSTGIAASHTLRCGGKEAQRIQWSFRHARHAHRGFKEPHAIFS